MLKNFEEQTHELNEWELRVVVPILIRGFYNKVGKDKAITNNKICKSVNEELNLKHTLTEPRVRKCINYVRTKNLIPFLIATSKGYYVATNKKELEEWRDSLSGRINSIKEVLDYAEKQIEMWDTPKTPPQPTLF